VHESEDERRQSEPGKPVSQQEIESGVVHNRRLRYQGGERRRVATVYTYIKKSTLAKFVGFPFAVVS
jgi:hypothetical protein